MGKQRSGPQQRLSKPISNGPAAENEAGHWQTTVRPATASSARAVNSMRTRLRGGDNQRTLAVATIDPPPSARDRT